MANAVASSAVPPLDTSSTHEAVVALLEHAIGIGNTIFERYLTGIKSRAHLNGQLLISHAAKSDSAALSLLENDSEGFRMSHIAAQSFLPFVKRAMRAASAAKQQARLPTPAKIHAQSDAPTISPASSAGSTANMAVAGASRESSAPATRTPSSAAQQSLTKEGGISAALSKAASVAAETRPLAGAWGSLMGEAQRKLSQKVRRKEYTLSLSSHGSQQSFYGDPSFRQKFLDRHPALQIETKPDRLKETREWTFSVSQPVPDEVKDGNHLKRALKAFAESGQAGGASESADQTLAKSLSQGEITGRKEKALTAASEKSAAKQLEIRERTQLALNGALSDLAQAKAVTETGLAEQQVEAKRLGEELAEITARFERMHEYREEYLQQKNEKRKASKRLTLDDAARDSDESDGGGMGSEAGQAGDAQSRMASSAAGAASEPAASEAASSSLAGDGADAEGTGAQQEHPESSREAKKAQKARRKAEQMAQQADEKEKAEKKAARKAAKKAAKQAARGHEVVADAATVDHATAAEGGAGPDTAPSADAPAAEAGVAAPDAADAAAAEAEAAAPSSTVAEGGEAHLDKAMAPAAASQNDAATNEIAVTKTKKRKKDQTEPEKKDTEKKKKKKKKKKKHQQQGEASTSSAQKRKYTEDAEPSITSEPSESAVPVKPVDPSEPVELVASAEPAQPAEPAHAQPTEPAEPAKPMEPVASAAETASASEPVTSSATATEAAGAAPVAQPTRATEPTDMTAGVEKRPSTNTPARIAAQLQRFL